MKASYDSPAGPIYTSWMRENGVLELKVTVPPNCEATVHFPAEEGREVTEASGYAKAEGEIAGYALFKVAAGSYRFSNGI